MYDVYYYIINSLQNRRFCTEALLPLAHIAQANFRCSKTNFAIRQSVRAFARGGKDFVLAVLFYFIINSLQNRRFCTEALLPLAHIAQANFRCSKTNFALRQSVRAFARGGKDFVLAVLFYFIINSLQNRRFCTEALLPRAHIAQANFRCSKTNFALRQSVRAFARGGKDFVLAVLFYYITPLCFCQFEFDIRLSMISRKI